jgi:FkbM family methyltransferase
MRHPHLIHSSEFARATAGSPLTLVDVGARGDLDPPWNAIPPPALQVIGFEPDVEECARLSARAPRNRRFLPIALWSQQTEVEVHVAATPSCSSVHPPNDALLRQFATEHGDPRTTRATVRYPARTLDESLEAEGVSCDFLKIDTQGSEWEIVCGASRTLKDHALGALIETWTAEVHRGQRLTGAVMSQMHELGFQLFDVGVAAAWRRRRDAQMPLMDKAQVVGLDLLYLRDPSSMIDPRGSELQALKAAALAEVFGFPGFALELLESAETADWTASRDVILAAARARRAPAARARRLFRRLWSRQSGDFAPLHA